MINAPVRKIRANNISVTYNVVPLPRFNKSIQCESKHEFDYVVQSYFDPTITNIEHQPLTIIYEMDGKEHKYTPDFRITRSLQIELIEIKGWRNAQIKKAEYKKKFSAIRPVVEAMGNRFRLLLDTDFSLDALDNAHKLFMHRAAPLSDYFPDFLDICREKLIKGVKYDELLKMAQKYGFSLNEAHSLIYAMLGRVILYFDLRKPLNPQTNGETKLWWNC